MCPSDTTEAGCINNWFGRPVEERITRLFAAIPSFNVLTLQDPPAWAPAEPLTDEQRSTLEELIPRVIEQLTGEAFSGEVTFRNEWKEEAGWVDVTLTGGEFWRERFGSEFVRTGGFVGADPGQIVVNMDVLEDAACGGLARLFSHATGVALGFSAVEEAGHLMSSTLENRPSAASEAEMYHARLTWKLGRGAPYTDDPR